MAGVCLSHGQVRNRTGVELLDVLPTYTDVLRPVL
jgi:hypothetical protein